MKQIIPSIIAKNQQEFNELYNKIKWAQTIHLDVMDGKFVKNKSLHFSLLLPKRKYQTHLMVKNPIKWIPKVINKSKSIIIHYESCNNEKEIFQIIKKIKSKKKKVGLAINPQTHISKIKPFLKIIDIMLIMSVNPGNYGSKFTSSTIKKAKKARKLYPQIKIGIDGGINEKTLKEVKPYADFFISGSYIQNSENPKQAFNKLKTLANK